TRSDRDWSSDVCSSDLMHARDRSEQPLDTVVLVVAPAVVLARISVLPSGICHFTIRWCAPRAKPPSKRTSRLKSAAFHHDAPREIGRASCREGVASGVA